MKFKRSSQLIIICLNILIIQNINSFSQSSEPIKTDIFWLNLCTPNELNSVIRPKSGRNRYEINWKNNLSFGLININQFRYDYKINSIPFAAFVDSSYGGFSNTIASILDLTSNPYFNFVVKVKSPTKENFQKLKNSIDSAQKVYDDILNKMDAIRIKFDSEEEFKKNKDALKQFKELDLQGSAASRGIENLKTKINMFSYEQQYNALKRNFYKLHSVEAFLFDTVTAINTITESNYNKSDYSNKEFVTSDIAVYNYGFKSNKPDYSTYISLLLSFFQQNAEYIRTLFSQFEVVYETEKNYLVSSQFKNYNNSKKKYLDSLLNMFIKTKNVFIELNDLYAISPLQDNYLEDYLATEQQFSLKLFSQYMGLSKIMNVDTTYITPTTSNMKNFDLIKIELEKTDKTNNKPEKYDYDIFLKGGLKVDFSAGVFGSFLKNDEYSTVDSLDANNQTTDKKMIRVKDQGKLNIGFGGMVNVTVRSGASWFAPGFSFGFILDTKPSLQFLSSFTLAMGKSERLLLHAGYAMGFVKRIDGLKLNENIPTISIGNTIPTIDRFLARPFFGLSYNLSKNNVFKVTSFSTSTNTSSTTQ